ncbi:hypothetical protein [Microvirga soli]|uniref:hypothetical protein n=1 Tax=Microvirga soli TaxID=1854496 RepID=UPI00191F8594|nr:hypothetical protein [Microvirga soli]
MKLDLIMSTSEDVAEAQSAVPEAPVAAAEQNAAYVNDVQPADVRKRTLMRGSRGRKTSSGVEQRGVFQPMIEIEQVPVPEMRWPTMVGPMNAAGRRLTKRQSAATQLPRHERWKRRIHPASW